MAKTQVQIALLELLLPFKEYTEARKVYDEAKQTQRQAHEAVKVLKQNMQPILQRKESVFVIYCASSVVIFVIDNFRNNVTS